MGYRGTLEEYGSRQLCACTLAGIYDKNGDGNFEEASYDLKRDGDKNGKSDWRTVIDFLISKGWFWGGNFKTLFDAPHFQYDFGYSWKQLLALHNAKKFIKGTTYVQI